MSYTMVVHTPEIILLLSKVPTSFNSMVERFKISPSTLSRVLKVLLRSGCIKKKDIGGKGRGLRSEYSLTAKGKRVVPLMQKHNDTMDQIRRVLASGP